MLPQRAAELRQIEMGPRLTGLTLRSIAAAIAASTFGTACLAVSTSCSSSSNVCLWATNHSLGLSICIKNAQKATVLQQQSNVHSLERYTDLQAAMQTLHLRRHQAWSADGREGKRGHLYSSTCSLRGQPSWRACSVQAALPGQDGATTAYSHMSHLQMRQSMSSVSVYMPCSSTAPAAEESNVKLPVLVFTLVNTLRMLQMATTSARPKHT